MGRTKQFDQHAALDQAMELFWARGYHATSIQDLVDHLGVNRQSLYDTFGDKDALFQAALARYRELGGIPMRRTLENEGPIGEVLRAFFDAAIEGLMKNDGKGCLLVNTATELAPHDDSIFRICSDNAHNFETAFIKLLSRAQQKGELPKDRSVRQLARFLLNTMNGLAVTAKATRDRRTLKDAVDVSLSVLGV